MLFGGETTSGVSSDTWHWNGSSWSEVTPADPEGDGKPSARDSHTMAWDKTRQKSVLFGGFGYTVFNSTWAWDGTSWEYLEVADPFGDTNPVPRSDARMAYDQNRESLVLTGGNIAAHDTWEGLSAFYQRPGHIFRVPFIAANNCDKPDLTSITVNWIAGARGWSATGEERAGINMRLWDHGEWDSLGFYYTPTPETPMLMSRTFDDPLQVARILTGDYQTLSVLMRNRFYNYWTGAEIVTDYVEAIFRYRIDADAPDACE